MKTFCAIHRRLLLVVGLSAVCGAIGASQGLPAIAATAADPTAVAAMKQFGVEEIVFATRKTVGEHWYANFGYYANSKIPADNHLYRINR